MQIDFAFYSFLISAVLFFVIWLLTNKSKGLAWVVTVIVGLLVVSYGFQPPQQAPDIAGLANNATLAISKVIYGAAWGGAALLLHTYLP